MSKPTATTKPSVATAVNSGTSPAKTSLQAPRTAAVNHAEPSPVSASLAQKVEPSHAPLGAASVLPAPQNALVADDAPKSDLSSKIDDPLLANLKEEDHPSWNDPNWKENHDFGDHVATAESTEAAVDLPAAVGQHPPDVLSLSLPPADAETSRRLRARYMYQHRRDSAYWLSFGFFREDYRDPSLLSEAPFCENINVFHPARFYPVHYTTGAVLADSWERQCDRLDDFKKQSVGLHWWNKIAGSTALGKESLLAVIMRTQCPGVMEAYGLAALQIV
ncbi:hypothetical protein HDU86_008241 [Geranomyces michiganensis]|nr:hypothetical protein HDU86_008241 [Geranomyces michiganensis]